MFLAFLVMLTAKKGCLAIFETCLLWA